VKRLALRNMLSGGALSLVRLIMGVIKVKIVALWLGVGGVGLFSLLAQMTATGTALVSMSLAVPLINLGRRHVTDQDFDRAGLVAGTVLAVLASNATILMLGWGVVGTQLVALAGGADAGLSDIWPLLLAILVGAAASAFGEGMTFLCDRFDAYVRASMASVAVDAVAIGSAAWLFGLKGAVFALPAGPIALALAYAVQMSADRTARQILPRLRASFALLPNIFAYCALMVGTVSLTNLVQTALRAKVLAVSGAEPNGYLQVATALASYLLSFVMTGFWGHLHARAASEGDSDAVRAELGKSVRLGMAIAFGGCVAAIVLAPLVIALFYSHAFGPAAALLRPYMFGEFAFQTFSMLAAYQLTIGRRRRYALFNLLYIGTLAAAGWQMIPQFGAMGYVVAHVSAAGLAGSLALASGLRSGQIAWRDALLGTGLWAGVGAALLVLVGLPSGL
jgi:O-antigen/teichoic acid export membrane protein